jgi:hypothetical protein
VRIMVKKETLVYQIKVTLKDTHPPIWRRIVVPENTTLLKLHDILQIVMGWEDYHLHLFTVDGENYGDPADDEYGDLGTMPEQSYKLNELIHGEGQRFVYEYDFGDGWIHVLRVEKIGPPREGVRYPVCTGGRRTCPPEDVGGVWGYENFLEAIRDPDHPEHDEYLTWIGGEFDPDDFDLEEVNEQLRHMGRGRSTERLSSWSVLEPQGEQSSDSVAMAGRWLDNLPAEQQAVAEALPLRRDVVAMLTYLRDNRATGTPTLGNLPLKAVREICAQFVDPPALEQKIGDHVYAVRSENDVRPLYFRHVLASVARLVEGGPGRRWRLTLLGEAYLTASAPAQVWTLWFTWCTEVNWGINSHVDLRNGVPVRSVRRALAYVLGLHSSRWIPFDSFADALVHEIGLVSSIEDEERARRVLHAIIERIVADPLAQFGALERKYEPSKMWGERYRDLGAVRMTPFGRGLLEAIEPLRS